MNDTKIIKELMHILDLDCEFIIPCRVEELSAKLNNVKSLIKSGQLISKDYFYLVSYDFYSGNIVAKLSEMLKTNKQNIIPIIRELKQDFDKLLK